MSRARPSSRARAGCTSSTSRPAKPSRWARDDDDAKRLWTYSEQLCGVHLAVAALALACLRRVVADASSSSAIAHVPARARGESNISRPITSGPKPAARVMPTSTRVDAQPASRDEREAPSDPGAVIGHFDRRVAYVAAAARASRTTRAGYAMTARGARALRVTRTIGRRGLQEYVGVGDGATDEVRLPFGWWPRAGGWLPQLAFDPWLADGSLPSVRAGRAAVGRALPVVPLDVPVRAAHRARMGRRASVRHEHCSPDRAGERSSGRRRADHDRHQLRELPPRRSRARRRRRRSTSCRKARRRARARRSRASRSPTSAATRACQRGVRAVPFRTVAAARRSHRAAQLERGARSRRVAVHRDHVHRLPRSASRRRALRRGALERGVRALPRQPRDAAAARAHAGAGHDAHECLDCHMPKIVMGIDRYVRTHRISSPTDPAILCAMPARTPATRVTSIARSRGPPTRSRAVGRAPRHRPLAEHGHAGRRGLAREPAAGTTRDGRAALRRGAPCGGTRQARARSAAVRARVDVVRALGRVALSETRTAGSPSRRKRVSIRNR